MLFAGSLFEITWYLQALFFNLHVIYRLHFSIYMLFTDPLFRFTCYLQAPFLKLHVIYKLSFSIYMLFTVFWQPPCIKFICYLRVSRLNHKKFTGY